MLIPNVVIVFKYDNGAFLYVRNAGSLSHISIMVSIVNVFIGNCADKFKSFCFDFIKLM